MAKQGIDLNFGELFNACAEKLSADPTLTSEYAEGYFYYNTTLQKFRGRTATGWVTLGGTFIELGTALNLFEAGTTNALVIDTAINSNLYMPAYLEVFGGTTDFGGVSPGGICVVQSAQLLCPITPMPLAGNTLRIPLYLPVERDFTIGSNWSLGSDLFGGIGANDLRATLYGILL